MPQRDLATSPRTTARIIGVLYLLIFFVGPFAFFMGRVSVVVPGDPAATIANLMDSETVFRMGMVAETIIVLVEIAVSALIYVLFRPVSRPVALAAALARFAQSLLQAANLMTAVPALVLFGGSGYVTAMEPELLESVTLLFMDVNAFVILVWGLLFGFHLLLLGWLVFRSGFIPRPFGALLVVGGVGYLMQSYGHLVAPQYDEFMATAVVVLSVPAELAFTLWLLWKGVDVDAWRARNRELAEA